MPRKLAASTCCARPAAAGSFSVIRHSVRGYEGSTSVAECSSEALSQMTTSPTPYDSESRYFGCVACAAS
jgi:hypothetical protein